MTDTGIVNWVRAAASAGAFTTVAAGVMMIGVDRDAGDWFRGHHVVVSIFTLGFAIVIWLAIRIQPRNRTLWAMTLAMLASLNTLAYAIAPHLTDAPADALRYPGYVPADHPASIAVIYAVAESLTQVGVFGSLALCFLLVPDGVLPGRRWRWLAGLALAVNIGAGAAYAVAFRPGSATAPEDNLLLGWFQIAALVVVVASAGALWGRFRSSRGTDRRQAAWVLSGALTMAFSYTVGVLMVDHDDSVVPPVIISIGFAALIASFGVAIGRYHLYDVRFVVSRTLVYGALALVITVAYVGTVVGAGAVLGGAGEPNTVLAIAATAVVAATFQPIRRRLQGWADRLVYGRRVSPREVLSEFARRVRANDDRLLDLVPRSLVEGTGARTATVTLVVDGTIVREAVWPAATREPSDGTVVFPIRHDGVEFGRIELSTRATQRISDRDRSLAEEVAADMGLAMRNRALTEALALRVSELRRSRRRLVALQDETRRRLERDLHDGVQQRLVAIRVKVGLAQAISSKEGGDNVAAALADVAGDADEVIDEVRNFARGVYPPLLETEGLGPAVHAVASRAPVPVEVRTQGLGRYERLTESTVNLCISEALRSVADHPSASSATVAIVDRCDCLEFEVRDDGIGCAGQALGDARTGFASLADRVDALGGSLVTTRATGGTIVHGMLPIGPDNLGPNRVVEVPGGT